MKKEGFTLIEMIIALAIGSIVVGVAYTLLNNSSIALNKNINFVENQGDINVLTKIITQDIKLSKKIDVTNKKVDEIEYKLVFVKNYADNNLYKLVRKNSKSEVVLFNNVVENGFIINKKSDNLYEIILKYFENSLQKEHKFYIAKKSNSSSIETPATENPNEFDYMGHFVTVDFLKNPMVHMIESISYNGIPSSNTLNFTFLSKGQDINRNFDLMILNDSITLGYDFNDDINNKYGNPKPFETKTINNRTEVEKVYGIYIKNIDKIDGNNKNEIEIDAQNYIYGDNLYFTVELNNKRYVYKLDEKGNSSQTSSNKVIKIWFQNKRIHSNGKLQLYKILD